jgi:hypothetical protein
MRLSEQELSFDKVWRFYGLVRVERKDLEAKLMGRYIVESCIWRNYEKWVRFHKTFVVDRMETAKSSVTSVAATQLPT